MILFFKRALRSAVLDVSQVSDREYRYDDCGKKGEDGGPANGGVFAVRVWHATDVGLRGDSADKAYESEE